MELRKISADSIPTALQKARHYRLLNDPENAESICRDILEIEPENQPALACLVLALTDQFDGGSAHIAEAQEFAQRIQSEYERCYLLGLISERNAKQLLTSHRPDLLHDAFDWFQDAMRHFDQAERLATDEDNDDPILRWNSCVRLIEKHRLAPRAADTFRPYGD
jgi:hypothetical protein